MTERVCVMAHAGNFMSVKKVLGDSIREIDYPTKEDPSYLIRAEVPVNMIQTIRDNLAGILGK